MTRHDCRDVVSVDKGARWVAVCSCGTKSIAITIAGALRAHNGHATIARRLEGTKI